MSNPKPTNIAASIIARLKNHARQMGRPFQEVAQYYALERFLYRLTTSEYAARFVLKGALTLRVWGAPTARPTRDIDLLGRIENDPGALMTAFKTVAALDGAGDGIMFPAATFRTERIKEDADYAGVRVRFQAKLGTMNLPMQIDIGFGDVVTPMPELADFPTILGHAAPRLTMYPLQTVVAEKLEAMVRLGTLNSRFKDFYDIWLLARHFAFDGASLVAAISATCAHRGTVISGRPAALTEAFYDSPRATKQWAAFVRRTGSDDIPDAFSRVCTQLAEFLVPPLSALATHQRFEASWLPAGSWQEM